MFIEAFIGSSPACLNKTFCRVSSRNFSLSGPNNGHYETLNVSRNASRAAIKANFYKLSKKYHPDVNKDSDAKNKFQAVSEAWSVLGDDRKRREYDRRIEPTSSSFNNNRPPYSQPGHYGYSESYTARRRGATYAWEYTHTRRTSRSRPPPPPPPFGQSHARTGTSSNPFGGSFRSGTVGDDDMWWPFSGHPHPSAGRTTRTNNWRDPFSSIHVRRATGQGSSKGDENASKTQERERERQEWTTAKGGSWTKEDRLRNESVIVRIAQVIGLLFFIILLGGGFR